MQKAANARLVHLNEQLVFPLLQRNCESVLGQMCSEFKSSGAVSVSKLAYISACRDLIQELSSIARNGDTAAASLHERNNKENEA